MTRFAVVVGEYADNLNACQIAQDAGGLLDSGSFGQTFTSDGAVGFVAPLWEVDDELAETIAVEFYDALLRQGMTAGEARRQCRRAWTHGSGTRLAYLFWGHTELRLHLVQEATAHDGDTIDTAAPKAP